MSTIKARVAVIHEGGTWGELQIDVVDINPRDKLLAFMTEAEKRASIKVRRGAEELPKGTLGVHYIGIVGGWPEGL